MNVASKPSRRARLSRATSLYADLGTLPRRTASEFPQPLASAHGVAYRRPGLDDWAEAVTRASGDDVRLDATKGLLVSLKNRRVISERAMSRLPSNHLKQVSNVR